MPNFNLLEYMEQSKLLESLKNIFNTPFLAHIHTDYGHFVLVKRINSKCLTYIYY